MTRHRPVVRRRIGATDEGEAYLYRAVCGGCGWSGTDHPAHLYATDDRDAHLVEVTPPEEERCRQPKRHRSAPHDRCALCADQLALPGL
ncbi:hypothetical protein HNR25_005183 [Streptomonospora salina]|uniref:Uncharacterized protein n=1 Tax=Streptomonospora salina TaxID=104205 RepID=A0A841EDU6_9ACTN|nr:hypothetical protein [Streptomonospora salina]MBB6001352.1 hypothetical protein [Streptomonospora salina]